MAKMLIARLRGITKVVAVGSDDGVCTTAALLRLVGRQVGLVFTQAFTVDKVDVEGWEPGRKVALVDLAVNNRDKSMTVAFVARLRDAGHELVAVIDEHSRVDWFNVLREVFPCPLCGREGTFCDETDLVAKGQTRVCRECKGRGLDSELDLAVEPRSQDESDIVGPVYGICDGYCPSGRHTHAANPPKSSGEVLRRALVVAGVEVDSHTLELLEAADAGDRMDFTTHFGGFVNSAVKSSIADDSRRVYLARHFAVQREPDEKILGWIAEYEAILTNHDKVVAGRVDLGDGIHRVTATGLAVDMTTLMGRLYREGARVVALEGEAFSKALGRKTLLISFGTIDKGLDLLSIVKSVVPSASGFAQKVNVDPEYEAVALTAIRAILVR